MKYFIVPIAAALLTACVSAPSDIYGVHQAKPEKSEQQHVPVDVAHSATAMDSAEQH